MGIIENNKARKLPNKCRSRNKKKISGGNGLLNLKVWKWACRV